MFCVVLYASLAVGCFFEVLELSGKSSQSIGLMIEIS